MAFRVGQKVVCVDDTQNVDWTESWLLKGRVYEIAEIISSSEGAIGYTQGWTCALRLSEIARKPNGFASFRFRPLTDISIFTAMLNTTKRGVNA